VLLRCFGQQTLRTSYVIPGNSGPLSVVHADLPRGTWSNAVTTTRDVDADADPAAEDTLVAPPPSPSAECDTARTPNDLRNVGRLSPGAPRSPALCVVRSDGWPWDGCGPEALPRWADTAVETRRPAPRRAIVEDGSDCRRLELGLPRPELPERRPPRRLSGRKPYGVCMVS